MASAIYGIPVDRLLVLAFILGVAILVLLKGDEAEIRKSAVEVSRWVFAGVVAGMTLAAAGTDNIVLMALVIPYAMAIGIAGDYIVRRVYRFPDSESVNLDDLSEDEDG